MASMKFPPEVARNPFRRIRYIPGQPVSYLKNPKVASTSIELTLWRAHSPTGVPLVPHGHSNAPFVQRVHDLPEAADAAFFDSSFFSVVRNPFARVLSAYLNKVGPRKHVWQHISLSIGLKPETHPSLDDLLRALLDHDPFAVDKHFQPQWINILHGLAPLDYLGHLERMQDVSAYLQRYGLVLEHSGINATNANEKVGSQIGPGTADLIRRYYADDFRLYGYSDDPSVLIPIRDAEFLNPSRDSLRQIIVERRQYAANRRAETANRRAETLSGRGRAIRRWSGLITQALGGPRLRRLGKTAFRKARKMVLKKFARKKLRQLRLERRRITAQDGGAE
jgi:hypothetical protein